VAPSVSSKELHSSREEVLKNDGNAHKSIFAAFAECPHCSNRVLHRYYLGVNGDFTLVSGIEIIYKCIECKSVVTLSDYRGMDLEKRL